MFHFGTHKVYPNRTPENSRDWGKGKGKIEPVPIIALLHYYCNKLTQTVANRIIEITPKGIIDKANTTLDDYLSDEKIKKQLHELYS